MKLRLVAVCATVLACAQTSRHHTQIVVEGGVTTASVHAELTPHARRNMKDPLGATGRSDLVVPYARSHVEAALERRAATQVLRGCGRACPDADLRILIKVVDAEASVPGVIPLPWGSALPTRADARMVLDVVLLDRDGAVLHEERFVGEAVAADRYSKRENRLTTVVKRALEDALDDFLQTLELSPGSSQVP